MKSIERRIGAWLVVMITALVAAGCGGPTIHASQNWQLPAKTSPESAMFVGRIGLPDGKYLALRDVNFQRWGKAYVHMGTVPRGEKNFIMDNNYFVIPNVKSGTYWFAGFYAASAYNRLPADKKDFIEIKPGEVKFIGSYDYFDGKLSTLRMSLGIPGAFGLQANRKPSEAEMLKWLITVGNGSGWEPAIQQRARALGAKL